MDFNQARAEFGKILGLIPGTPEFDGAIATFQTWYDAHADSPDFAQAVAAGEKEFGKELGLKVARFLAEEEARKRR